MDLMCPMMSDQYNKKMCAEGRCAWWVGKGCAVYSLAGGFTTSVTVGVPEKKVESVPVPEPAIQE